MSLQDILQYHNGEIKTGKDTVFTQYQKNLTKDINTTMALYPGYVDKNVKKKEEVGLDAECWTR